MLVPVTTIKTQRLLLRPLQEPDIPVLMRIVLDPNCSQYLVVPEGMRSPEGASRGFEELIQSYDSPEPPFALAIADVSSGECWGVCLLLPFDEVNTAELVCALIPERQNMRVAPEAAHAVMKYALSNGKLEHIVGFVFEGNARSVRFVERLGFNNEGPAMHFGRPSTRFRATRGMWKNLAEQPHAFAQP